jgi:tricarballylate dehydrogenase
MVRQRDYDVIVVGAGNAALSAAYAAHAEGARVVALEKATKELRGGNTRFTTGAVRFAYKNRDDIAALVPDLTPEELENLDVTPYTKDDFYNDLMRVTEGLADPELSELLVSQSYPTLKWLTELGVRWEMSGVQRALKRGHRARFYSMIVTKGAGLGLSDQQFEIAERLGIEVHYEAKGGKIITDDQTGRVIGIRVRYPDGNRDLYAGAVVLGCGGFEANKELRVRYMGPRWDEVKVRGTKYNTGEGLMMAIELGAQAIGQWSGGHATPVDAASPDFGSLDLTDHTRRASFAYGLMVNENCDRFADEGEDFMPYTYAKMGRIVQDQPHRQAFQIFDQKGLPFIERSYYGTGVPVEGDTITEIAEQVGLDPEKLNRIVDEYNRSVDESIEFNPWIKDGKSTAALNPPKTNWAARLDTPPFAAYPVTGGLTFTFGGVKIDRRARVIDTEDNPISGLYAAGELTGGFFYFNYPGASGLTRGAVTGRIAGTNAAREALGKPLWTP